MSHSPRIGYVVKRYPRFSETFIVNEVLAHEAAGTDIEIFSIRPCTDTHFQNAISQVRAPLTRISSSSPKWSALWPQLRAAGERFPGLWDVLRDEQHAMATTVAQGIELAGYVRDRHITHLHAHFATLPAAVARLAALIAEVPYSLTAHAKDIFHESVEDAVLQQRLEDAAAIITVSQFNVEHLSSRFPQLAEPFALRLQRFEVRRAAVSRARDAGTLDFGRGATGRKKRLRRACLRLCRVARTRRFVCL